MFEKYAAFRVGDFVQDERFIRWIQTPDAESDRFWQDFQETFPYQRPVIRQAILAVQNLASATQITVEQTQSAEIWENLQNSITASDQRKKWWRGIGTKAAVAACALIGMSYIIYALYGKPQVNLPFQQPFSESSSLDGTGATLSESTLEKITNITGSSQIIDLPDDSQVTLQPGGTIRFNRDFDDDSRNVHLEGEAFFDVTRDTERPFFVHSNGLTTKVLGTSFVVKAEKGSDRVQVVVRTGKVTVFTSPKSPDEDPESQGLVLRANQQVDYSRSIEKFTRTLIPEPVPVLPMEELQAFTFRDAPVNDIFEALGRVYDAEILFDQELLSDCRLTSTLNDDVSLFEKLDVVCEAIGASYKIVDAQIIISGRKCS